jgi:hypothetical protein
VVDVHVCHCGGCFALLLVGVLLQDPARWAVDYY